MTILILSLQQLSYLVPDRCGKCCITAIEVTDWLSPNEPADKPAPEPPPDFNPPGSLDLPGHDPGKPIA